MLFDWCYLHYLLGHVDFFKVCYFPCFATFSLAPRNKTHPIHSKQVIQASAAVAAIIIQP